jgi:hypothetical protein
LKTSKQVQEEKDMFDEERDQILLVVGQEFSFSVG